MVKQPFACGECNRILPDPEKKSDPPQCMHCGGSLFFSGSGRILLHSPQAKGCLTISVVLRQPVEGPQAVHLAVQADL